MNITQFFCVAARQPQKRFFPLAALCLAAILLPATCSDSTAIAQNIDNEEPEEIPPPEDLNLTTSDGVKLAATYYGGTGGKETVPVVLLHMFKRNRNDYSQLAPYLQSLGHAVLVPDLRGHGDSTQQREVNRSTGKVVSHLLDASSMNKNDFMNMIAIDMPMFKQFLIDKNNAGKLNIEKLCVVGAEMGASVAINWAYFDWSRPPEGNRKMGQDLKAMVLISPEWSTPGLPLKNVMVQPPLRIMIFDLQLKKAIKDSDAVNFRRPVALDFRSEVSVLIVAGKGNSRAVRDAKRLQTMFKTHHGEPPSKDQQDLFYGTLDTSLQGTKMLGVRGLNIEKHIAQFIQRRAAKRPFTWAKRTDPYEGR